MGKFLLSLPLETFSPKKETQGGSSISVLFTQNANLLHLGIYVKTSCFISECVVKKENPSITGVPSLQDLMPDALWLL